MKKKIFLKKNKELLKYFNKSNVKKYYIKRKYKHFLINVFNNFLYYKEILICVQTIMQKCYLIFYLFIKFS